MKYITGIHALNLNCSLETPGDWHQSALQWHAPRMRETKGSFFGEYGIETNSNVPENKRKFYTANHIRALLDLLEEKNFPTAQGMRANYICNDKYTQEIFQKVLQMKSLPNWQEISNFMGKEYMLEWLNFLRENQ